jgi:pilus assembly protein FimV
LVAKDKSLKEAKSRITELEKNVGEMKKLAELKSQNLAELQKQAQATGKPGSLPAPTPSAVPVPAVKPAPPPVAAAAAPAVVATAKPVVEAPKPVEPPKPAEAVAEKPLEVAKPAEPVEKKPVPIEQKRTEPATAKPAVVAPPAQAPDFIDENPELVYGGGGIVALLLGYLGYSAMRRRGEKGESSPQSQPSEEGLTANSVFGMTGGRSVDTSNSSIQTDFSQSGMGSIDTDEGVDPVAEADVYMAYGRDAQAEEILVDALKTDPHRLAIHLKLLEIYAGRNSVQQFEALAGEVFALTAGSGVEWDKATALGRGIDPDNPLYALKVSGDDVIESTTEAPSPVDASTGSQGTATRGLAAEPLNVTRVAQTQPETPAEPQPDQSPAALDFDLDLGAQTQPGEDFGLPAASAVDFDLGVEIAGHPVSEPVGGQSLEFRPNFEETTDTSNTLTSPPVSSVKPEVAAATEALSTETIDFDLALPVGDESFDAVVAGDGGKPLDFDFDLELPSSTPLPELAAVPAAAPMPATLPDQSEVLTDFAAQVERTAGNDDNASLDETTRQEVATKLELAQAYEEMGDSEGARELLQEVLEEGDQAQRDAARNRLALLV